MNQGSVPDSVGETCVFCRIVDGSEPASVICEDEHVMAFMTIRPTRPGECLVIPKEHIDHFSDLSDQLSTRIMLVVQKIGRKVREVFQPQRIGMVVHGFGVGHAHLIIVPQHHPDDITSARFAYLDGRKIAFDSTRISRQDRSTLDEHADALSIDLAEA